MRSKDQRKIIGIGKRIAVLFLICSIGYGQETLDLYPDQPGSLRCWTETRSDPRPLRIYFLSIGLNIKKLEVITLPGEDPDGKGLAESQLTQPAVLFRKFDALAAVNANAFSAISENGTTHAYWFDGQPVDIHGMVVARGKQISPVENKRTTFWLDTLGKPHIGDPIYADSVTEAISDWFCPLLLGGRIIADRSDLALHPRTALGFDDSGTWLLLVVIDGRQPGFSEGVTLYELANILQSQGCSQSINLDGGGSSIMLIRGQGKNIRTLNHPSGKTPRPVPVMLGVRLSTK